MSGQKIKTECRYNEFRRPRYFHGMLLQERDFQAEQGYHAAKRRMLNRMLHGKGIVCGLELVSEDRNRKTIEIRSGLALDCGGNEIWVDQDISLDLAALLRAEPPPKRECPEDNIAEDKKYRYVAIRYRENDVDPVSVYLPGGGCEQRTCEYSRTREGFCVELLRSCPADPQGKPQQFWEEADGGLLKRFCKCRTGGAASKTKDASADTTNGPPADGCLDCSELSGDKKCQCEELAKFCNSSVPCPDCGRCDEYDYVVLGRIDLEDKLDKIRRVCMNECRRYVLTGRLMQHMVISTLAGAEKHITAEGNTEPLPDAVAIAGNPIWALCWYVRNVVLEDRKLKLKDCGETPQKPDDRVTNEELEKRITEAIQNERTQTTKDIEGAKRTFEQRLNSTDKTLREETRKQIETSSQSLEGRVTETINQHASQHRTELGKMREGLETRLSTIENRLPPPHA